MRSFEITLALKQRLDISYKLNNDKLVFGVYNS